MDEGRGSVRDGWPKEQVTNVLVVVSDEPAGHLTQIPTDHEELEENPLLDRWGTLPPHRLKGGRVPIKPAFATMMGPLSVEAVALAGCSLPSDTDAS